VKGDFSGCMVVNALDGCDGIRWEAEIVEDPKKLFVADGVEGSCEVHIQGVQVLV